MSHQQPIWRPFLLFRSVIFALLTWFNVIALGFAIWDVVALEDAGETAFGPAIFIIFNSCATFLLLLRAIAELCTRKVKTAQVNVECAWSFIMATLHFASAVYITVMGPPMYCSSQDLVNVCAASTVLVIVTWLSSVTMMLYFLGLYMTAISHYWVYGSIWSTSVYDVAWFSPRDDFTPVSIRPSRKSLHDLEKGETNRYSYDSTSTPSTPSTLFDYTHTDTPRVFKLRPPPLSHQSSQETLRPAWAQSIQARRGVDQPFSLPGAKHLSRMIMACTPNSPPPSVPPKAKLYELPELELDLTPRYPSYSQFPESVHDEDKPISFQRLSQWVRADSAGSRSSSR
ncbi:hypothetical protein BXZ70DRAFT_914856 [Cristinia sonorae]|uniref:Transmembrane protein n=1 Tax=Cristinia sonorae TaxID=1940300 RepID=A0A8K0UWI9_9AGAR|nr:hypothetical protein BXZ70DRAFT_914856 [Cristinia sonorae]